MRNEIKIALFVMACIGAEMGWLARRNAPIPPRAPSSPMVSPVALSATESQSRALQALSQALMQAPGQTCYNATVEGGPWPVHASYFPAERRLTVRIADRNLLFEGITPEWLGYAASQPGGLGAFGVAPQFS
jgi:hypothetical protein